MYSVKETFYTLQGEGVWTGRASVFLRFSGCNLWSGREKDRQSAQCSFCDTDFVGTDGQGGGQFAAPDKLAQHVAEIWGNRSGTPYVVCTGGEPLLQLDPPFIQALKAVGFEVAVETNGTLKAPAGIDWVCVSPKANLPLAQTSGDELKLVYPQTAPHHSPDYLASLDFKHFSVQPMDSRNDPELNKKNLELALQFCLDNPIWRLSLQTHKELGIP